MTVTARTVTRADAKMIAETAADLADKALKWKARALAAEARLATLPTPPRALNLEPKP